MWTQIRHALIVSMVVALGASGLSYALTSNEVALETETSHEQSEEPETTVLGPDEETTPDGSDETEESPPEEVVVDEPTEEVTPPVDDNIHGTERSTEGCPEGETYKNHGQYVSSTDKGSRKEAAHSDCGKPIRESKDGEGEDGEGSDDVDEPEPDDDADLPEEDSDDEPTDDVSGEPEQETAAPSSRFS